MSLKHFEIAARNMCKYNSDSWHEKSGATPIVSEKHYVELKPETPIHRLLLSEYAKVRGHPFKTPQIRHILQLLISNEILRYRI